MDETQSILNKSGVIQSWTFSRRMSALCKMKISIARTIIKKNYKSMDRTRFMHDDSYVKNLAYRYNFAKPQKIASRRIGNNKLIKSVCNEPETISYNLLRDISDLMKKYGIEEFNHGLKIYNELQMSRIQDSNSHNNLP